MGDSLYLYNRIIRDTIIGKDCKLFYNGEYVFYPVKFIDSSNMHGYKTFTSLLKIGGEVSVGQ